MYIELQVTTNFSFLRGASHPDELVLQAAALGHDRLSGSHRWTGVYQLARLTPPTDPAMVLRVIRYVIIHGLIVLPWNR